MYLFGLLLSILLYFGPVRSETHSIYSDGNGTVHEESAGGASGPSRDTLMINFRRIFGRQCDLEVFPGTCVIKQVTPDKENQFASVLVDFIDDISNHIDYDIKYMIFLADPSIEYINKNNIVEGSEMACKKKVSKSGPCEPVHITFDSFDDATLVDQEGDDPLQPSVGRDEL